MSDKAKWLDVQRRKWIEYSKPDADGKRTIVSEREAPEWYGRMKLDGGWKWFKLFTDRRASQLRRFRPSDHP